MMAGRPSAQLTALIHFNVASSCRTSHSTPSFSPAASPTTSHPDCHYGHLIEVTVASFDFPYQDDAIILSKPGGESSRCAWPCTPGYVHPSSSSSSSSDSSRAPLLRTHPPPIMLHACRCGCLAQNLWKPSGCSSRVLIVKMARS